MVLDPRQSNEESFYHWIVIWPILFTEHPQLTFGIWFFLGRATKTCSPGWQKKSRSKRRHRAALEVCSFMDTETCAYMGINKFLCANGTVQVSHYRLSTRTALAIVRPNLAVSATNRPVGHVSTICADSRADGIKSAQAGDQFPFMRVLVMFWATDFYQF